MPRHQRPSAGALLAFLALAFVGVAARDAAACSCVRTASGHQPCQDRWTYSAVFVGRVLAIDPAPRTLDPGIGVPERRVRFAVPEAFSGVASNETIVFTGTGGGDCGYA